MQVQICISWSSSNLFIILLLLLPITASGYGSAGVIAAAFGENGFFCAIDAGGKQEIICWDKGDNFSASSSSAAYFSSLPSMAGLSGGQGFLCGIVSNTSQAFCFNLLNPGTNLVPKSFQYNSYSQISAGKYHVCGIRGFYYSSFEYGSVDCWEFNQTLSSFRNSYVDSVAFRSLVSGDGFSCGVKKDGGVVCWGPKSADLGASAVFGDFEILAAGWASVCGVASVSGELKCWGNSNEFGSPVLARYVSLTAGARHFCGIREDNHEVECWGNVDPTSVPKGSGFMAIASSDDTTCGVREVDLVLDCWAIRGQSSPGFNPPLQLCSPGVCSSGSCPSRKFAYNASLLNEPELTNLCVRKDLKICLRCGTNCSQGYFPSSTCSENADRICTACLLCQNSSCWDVCGLPSSMGIKQQERQEIIKLAIIVGCSVLGVILILFVCCFILRIFRTRDGKNRKRQCVCCISKPVVEDDPEPNKQPSLPITMSIGETQVFRLSELKDATHGFKEFSELGRGSFGFVYKAVLLDGRQVAVKRANAATIIHTNSREFEAELEILCGIRHSNIVNLLGYCAEMGERLLVYEFMPHGTLHDHLHGELSPLDWSLRLKISLQAARGLDYLHNEVMPPIVHRDVKSSNILLDSEWAARIADFGILSAHDRDLNGDMQSDVYNFGIVLLEILSGRKAYDRDCTPPGIVEWALPLIRKGRAAAIIDQNVALPRNVEPLLKLADVAELTLKENPSERLTMSNVASLLDQLVKIGLTL